MSSDVFAFTWDRDDESGRAAVAITPCDLDLDEQTRERIKARIAERLRAEGAAHADA